MRESSELDMSMTTENTGSSSATSLVLAAPAETSPATSELQMVDAADVANAKGAVSRALRPQYVPPRSPRARVSLTPRLMRNRTSPHLMKDKGRPPSPSPKATSSSSGPTAIEQGEAMVVLQKRLGNYTCLIQQITERCQAAERRASDAEHAWPMSMTSTCRTTKSLKK